MFTVFQAALIGGLSIAFGVLKGAATIKRKTLYGILVGWFLTPPLTGLGGFVMR